MADYLRRPRRVRPRLRLIPAVRKPRSDSALKTLPEEKQAEIGQLLASRSLTDVRSVLLEQGITTSEAALSEFWSWWQLRAALRRREDRVGELVERMKEDVPAIPEDRLFELGQSLFGALSIAEEDGRTWVNTQRLRLERERLEIDRRKVALLEQKLRNVQAEVTRAKDGGLTPETLQRIEEAAKLL